MSISTFDLFKIGIGPSSSHTVGPMVAARQFMLSLQQENLLASVDRVSADMYGSLGSTGKGHGTPKAVLLGLMGESPDSVDVATIAQRVADIKSKGKITLLAEHTVNFDEASDLILHRRETLPYHSNGMRFQAFDSDQQLLSERLFYSVGGGFVVDEEQAKQGKPIVEDKRKLAYPFTSAAELLQHCERSNISIANIMYANEESWNKRSVIDEKLDQLWQVMRECVDNGCAHEGELPGGLKVKRRARELHRQLAHEKNTVSGQKHNIDPLEVLDWVTLYALAVNEENAAGGRIVTAPTNGAAGIIPAVMHYYANFVANADSQGIRHFLLTSAAVGILFKENASISGAEVGCQGEVGSACSMAAGGLTAVLGGTPQQIENAAEIAMEHHLGLTCDPIGGLVQIPCIERNAVASVNAIHAARMALRNDGSHFVSLDKVIKTMRETGKDMMDKYKETARGGLATNVIEVPVSVIEC
ncbi:MAG: L-serine ammonia-lyase [Arenicella sp.]